MKDEALALALEALNTAYLVVEDDMLADEIQQAITAIKQALAQPAVPEGMKLVKMQPHDLAEQLYWEHPTYRGAKPLQWRDAPNEVRREWLDKANAMLAAAPVPPTKDVEISNMGKPFTVKAYVTPPAAPVQDQKSCKLCTHEQQHYMEMTGPCRACRFYSNFASATPPAQPATEESSVVQPAQPAQPPAQEFTCSTGLCHYKPAAQRQWVGLTDAERGKVYADWRWSDGGTSNLALCEAIEATLKEKNT